LVIGVGGVQEDKCYIAIARVMFGDGCKLSHSITIIDMML